MIRRAAAALCFAAGLLPGATKILVTVVEPKTGRPVADLRAPDFAVIEDKSQRKVEDAEFVRDESLDIMMLLDTSLAGPVVQPLAESFIGQIQAKDQVAVVAFHASADLIQDFTSSKELIRRAVSRVKYGNEPHVLDALYAAIDGGFRNTTFRRVVLLLTAGLEGPSRVAEREVVRLARRNQASIFPVYVTGRERSLMESLAHQTGGASFNVRDLQKSGDRSPGPLVFQVLRGHYVVTVSGNLGLGEKARVEVRRPGRLQVSALPLE